MNGGMSARRQQAPTSIGCRCRLQFCELSIGVPFALHIVRAHLGKDVPCNAVMLQLDFGQLAEILPL
jgi:hypothetical protein